MKIINRLTSANVGQTSLGRYNRTEVGAAIAHIPRFEAYYDAEYYIAGAKEILNMAKGTMTVLPNAFTSVTNEQGQKAVERIYVNLNNSVTHLGDFDIDVNGFSFFVVLDHYNDQDLNTIRDFRLVRKVLQDDLPSFHALLSNVGATARLRRTSDREANSVLTAAVDPVNKPSIIVFSYSNGVGSINVNGKVTRGAFPQPTSGLKAEEWDWFRNMNGKAYAWGGLNIDLALPENSGYLEQLITFYKNKYSIA
ncbi:hypothetical protein B9T31_08410 [Acinetobacter sp. ANC 4558]|uniref:hypothetical protein n=1 Tax=Acinetobacter sp. ANC 4558 TaxID=1977876 RepID=UPI000A331ED4|nr:hypothetical protein [Acinetobacter sp. ANC 4558]OTG86500.1 hypothetical protein B9T31_08410 [Acinetobacter sp. ANC 4558]